MNEVLDRRQPDLTVVLENIHDPHNVGAVLRSADAVGVLRIHTIYTIETPPEKAYSRLTSSGARKWLEVVHHDSVQACISTLRADGFRVIVTALGDDAVDLYKTNLTEPVALVFGNENRGVSQELLSSADAQLFIPMMGMAESLNISVACAVTLFEAMRQRQAANLYAESRLDKRDRAALAADWITR